MNENQKVQSSCANDQTTVLWRKDLRDGHTWVIAEILDPDDPRISAGYLVQLHPGRLNMVEMNEDNVPKYVLKKLAQIVKSRIEKQLV